MLRTLGGTRLAETARLLMNGTAETVPDSSTETGYRVLLVRVEREIAPYRRRPRCAVLQGPLSGSFKDLRGYPYHYTSVPDNAIGELCRCRYHSGRPSHDVKQASRSKRQPRKHDGV